MLVIKPVHIGGIDLGRERLFDVVKGSRHDVVYELNNWLFDYFHARNLQIKQLPPLDDWQHSEEDTTFWAVTFEEEGWKIWTKSTLIEHK